MGLAAGYRATGLKGRRCAHAGVVRFLVASLVLFVLLGLTGKLPRPSEFSKQTFFIGAGHYRHFRQLRACCHGFDYISPTTTQVLWQLALTMILVGVGVFKEAFTHWQKIGLMLLLTGLAMFFNDKFGELFSLGSYAVGVMMAASGSMIWVCYGVAQKLLSKHFNSQQILLMIYFAAALFSCRLPNRRKLPISAIRFYGAALFIAA